MKKTIIRTIAFFMIVRSYMASRDYEFFSANHIVLATISMFLFLLILQFDRHIDE